MARVHAAAERLISARPAALYALLAAYTDGHPSILPRRSRTTLC